jgi:molybdopterin-guanine dinucleotide biosynthesis protein A
LRHTALLLQPLCGKMLIGSSDNAHELPFALRVPDEWEFAGPLSAWISCLRRTETEYAIILSVDMPLITLGALKSLIESGPNSAWRISDKHFPMPAFVSKNILNTLLMQFETGERRLQSALKNAEMKYWDAPLHIIPLLNNCNTPQDLKSAQEFANKGV